MAAKKTSGRNRTTGATAKKKASSAKTAQDMHSFRSEVILWILLAVSILLFISNFGVGGAIGGFASNLIFGLFGLMAYFFPVFLFVGACFIVSNRGNGFAIVKLTASIGLLLFLCLALELMAQGVNVESMTNIFASYRYSFENHIGGGLTGGILAKICGPNFGYLGSWVITVIALIICIVLISEKSAFLGMKKSGKKVYNTAKEEHQRYQEEKRRRVEEQNLRRVEKKVEGVAVDVTLKKTKKKKSDDISELKPLEPIADTDFSVPIDPIPMQADPVPYTFDFEKDLSFEMEEVLQEEVIPEKVAPSVSEKLEKKSVKKEKLEEQESAAIADEINLAMEQTPKKYQYPPVSLLKSAVKKRGGDSQKHLSETAAKLQQTLKNFGVNVTIVNVSCGPAVTRYEIQPEMGVKVSKIVNLADDIKLNLAAADIRIEAPIPGKAAIGIEVPNKENVTVMFRELIESKEFMQSSSKIAFGAGKDIGGKVIIADIAKMPHVLIAGATGSGKSVCINTIIMSILYKAKPDEVKLIMIDPKVVELSVYNGIPHLMIPVVTEPKKAAGALNWAVLEMTDRYNKFAEYGVRDMKGYNAKVESLKDIEDSDKPQKMPQIVIIVDELADLMMVAPGDVEEAICRLAQLARAAGIHLVIATQRPSVNVITGLIKANMPSRVAFAVTSGIDSRTILDMNGAEKLLGKGDMLFFPQSFQKPLRVQGAFVTDDEVSAVVDFLKNENGEGSYDENIQQQMESIQSNSSQGNGNSSSEDDRDVLFSEVGKFLIENGKGSIGSIQRRFKVGFNRAARIMDQLEEAGLVGPEEGTKPRKILMSPEEFDQYIEEYV